MRQSVRVGPDWPMSPSKASTRASTRLTLPSRMATRSSKQKLAIAAAVDGPMPGKVASTAARSGKRPP